MLQQLSEAFGPAGCEVQVRALIVEAIKDHVDAYRVDAMGSLITVKRGDVSGDGQPLKVMVSAHMDEVGLMICKVGKDGLLKFRPVGGIDDRVLLSKRVLIGKDRVPGVIGMKPVHLLSSSEREQVAKSHDMTIDIGATKEEEAIKLVNVGDYAVFDTRYQLLAGGTVAKGKAFDDRAGCAVLVELLTQMDPLPFDLYGVFTVQEEVGLRGAKVAAYAIEPDVAIALEGTVCDDSPKERDISPTTEMGKGPAITMMDRSFVADRRLVKLLSETAEREGIHYQYKQPGVGGTDSGAIYVSKEGVATCTVSVPSRYIHSPVCMLSLKDFDNTVKLMSAALPRLAETAW